MQKIDANELKKLKKRQVETAYMSHYPKNVENSKKN